MQVGSPSNIIHSSGIVLPVVFHPSKLHKSGINLWSASDNQACVAHSLYRFSGCNTQHTTVRMNSATASTSHCGMHSC